MKGLLLILITVFQLSLCFAQVSDTSYIEVNPLLETATGFSTVEKWPMYPNGQAGINNHIITNLKYPEKAKVKKIEGRVVVSYVVQTDGSIGEIKVIESVHPLLDKEAIRVISLMDKWKPGIQRGEPVKTAYQQPFNFKL